MEVREPSAPYVTDAKLQQTEIGPLPVDWSVVPLISLAEKVMVGIASAATHAYRSTGVTMFRNQNIRPGGLETQDVLYIDPQYEQSYKNKRLKAGDLLTARTGYPGTTSLVPDGFDGAQSFTTLITRPRAGSVDPQYLCLYINGRAGQRYFEQAQIGGGQKNVNAASLKLLPVALPATGREQRAVARALTDADALIDSLEQLLTKKRQIKQGAMQELLTGTRRLPGFTQEWSWLRLGDIGQTYGGLVGKSKLDFGHGSAKYVTFMNVMSNVQTSPNAVESVHIEPSESQNPVQAGDLLFNGSSETPEEVALCSWVEDCQENLFLNSFCFGFRPTTSGRISGLFMAYFFRARPGRVAVSSLAQGATRYNIAKTALLRVSLKLPAYEEQVAIAQVLSDMDAEITALEARLTKARALKQAMAQALLTGRIRLPVAT